MPTVDVIDMEKQKIDSVELPEEIFNLEVRPDLLHAVIRWQQAKRRAGSASTKTRSEVRGGGHKPYRQKGTGRARAGTRSSPIWRSGGVAHGPTPRDFGFKLNKKVRRLGLKMALSSKLQANQLMVLGELKLEEAKTKLFVEVMGRLELNKALFVTPEADQALELSCRNLAAVKMIQAKDLNVYDLLAYDQVVILRPSLEKIVERLQ